MSSLYLHIPFCEHKCIYCDFYSVAPNGGAEAYDALVDRFLSSLRKEIDLRSEDKRFRVPYETIFFGGGTPSLLSPSSVEEILNLLATRFHVTRDAEITLETNPGTVDIEKLKQFKAAGVNRISMGIQSFHDDDLKFLSRIHSAVQAKECVRNAYRAGFENVSFDLIFALPSQTLKRWRANLEQAMELVPKHISTYSLIVEPNTPLQRMVESKQVMPLSAEADVELYEFTIGFLASHGYEQYEVSNFAQPGYKSRHNGNYWNHNNYLGFGPSAHSFWTGQRWWNVANVVEYSARLEQSVVPVAGDERLNIEQLRNEELFLGLRSEGVDIAGFQKRYKTDLLSTHKQTIENLLNDRLAVVQNNRFKLTAKGFPLCDEICSSLLV